MPVQDIVNTLTRGRGVSRYDPSNPYDFMSSNRQSDYGGTASRILGAAGGAGEFSPMGSPLLRMYLRRQAIRNANNLRRRSEVGSRLAGQDPYAARQSFVDSNRQAAGNVADTINQGEAQNVFGQRDFLRMLLTGRLGAEDSMNQLKEQERFQDSQKGTLGGQIGGLIGAGVGAFTGAAGTGLAGRMFK